MPISTITQTISAIPEAGHRGVDVQTQFVIKQEDFQDHLQGTTVKELNNLKTQMNTMSGEMNTTASQVNTNANTATTKASEASASANTATTKASEASTSANTATTQAGIATTKASEATTKASTATTQAGIATTKASEATTKANEASASATSASTSATSASTSASTATTKASEASASATSASTSASTATTKASEASASASQALTSRNQAGTFAQQAQASATSIDVNNLVHRTEDESIAGVKTFSSSPIVPTPTTGTQAVNKDYVDTKVSKDGTGATGTWGINITGNAATATTASNANKLIGKNWYWQGQNGQPTWLWGGSDDTNMYVYNPSNFNVNHANTCWRADDLGNHQWSSNDNIGYIRLSTGIIEQWGDVSYDFAEGTQIDVYFATTFPSACYNVVLCPKGAASATNDNGSLELIARYTNRFTVRSNSQSHILGVSYTAKGI